MMPPPGRSPVIAAPPATPENPASEIGVSMTRDFPNSSTSPDKTLNGVPASATSSPIRHTVGSRRISSASASRTASPSDNSRTATSGINVLLHFVQARILSLDRKFDRRINLNLGSRLNLIELRFVREFLPGEPIGKNFNGISFSHPGLFFGLAAILFAVHVADMMALIAVSVAQKKCRTFS